MAFVNIKKLNVYSKKASWAIWNEANLPAVKVAKSHLKANCTWMQENAGRIIQKNDKLLRTDIVILGINASKICCNWSNYHWGGKSADKNLMFSFDKSPYRGCYMSDFSQKIHKKGSVVYNELLADKSKLRFARELLTKELNDFGVPKNALFLLLGTHATKLFKIILLEEYNNFIALCHCSAHGISAHDWVENTWCKIHKYTSMNKRIPAFEVNAEMKIILSAL